MGMPARVTAELTDFPGLMSRVDPDALPEGAGAVQVNATSAVLGQLLVRGGYRAVTFAED